MRANLAVVCTIIITAGVIPSTVGFQDEPSTIGERDLAESSHAAITGTNSPEYSTVGLRDTNREGANDTQDIVIGELYNWSIIRDCLSDNQRESVSEVVSHEGHSPDQMNYSVESDGNVLFYTPPDFDPIAETKDDNFQCALVQDIVTVIVTPTQAFSSSPSPTNRPTETTTPTQRLTDAQSDTQAGTGGEEGGIGTNGHSLPILAGFALSFAMFAVVVVFVLYVLYREYSNTDETTTRT